MNKPINQSFLSEEEILFHRMEAFHRQRVEMIASGQSPLGERDDGFFVTHLLPNSSFKSRQRFDGSTLKQHGAKLSVFGADGNHSATRFNVDGFLKLDYERDPKSYSQIYRNGCLESVMSAINVGTHDDWAQPDQQKPKQTQYLKNTVCEQAVFKLAPEYLSFCKGIGLSEPIKLFSALVGCKGVWFYSNWGRHFGQSIDRSPAYLPDIDVESSDAEPEDWLRPWCDFLAQAMGLESSPNYDENGNWRERRR